MNGANDMNFQNILASVQKQADANGDGKVSVEDLDALAEKHHVDPAIVDSLKDRADVNGDGKVDLQDALAAFTSGDKPADKKR